LFSSKFGLERQMSRVFSSNISTAFFTTRRMLLKCDGTRAETIFPLSTKQTGPFKSAGASVQSTAGSLIAHISLQGLYCSCKPVFCSHVTLAGYPLHSLVSPSLLPCITACHHISNAVYQHSDFTHSINTLRTGDANLRF
jgi:hypothetical protein